MQSTLLSRLRLTALFLTLSLWALSCSEQKSFVTIGSGPLGGAYYTVGVGLGELIQRHVPDANVRIEVTGGALENPTLIENRQVELAFVNSHIAYLAEEGRFPFESPFRKMSALFGGLAPGVSQYVVRDNSTIWSMRDLKGLRVAAGAQGSSGAMVLSDVLKFHGMDMSDIRMSYVSFSEGVRALLDGKLDMAVVQSAAPAPAVVEAIAGGHEIRLLEWGAVEREKFLNRHPYYSALDLDPSVYQDYFDHPLLLIASENMLVVDSELEAGLVYEMTKAIFDHLDEFHSIHPSARWVTPQRAVNTSIPLHPGAARYFAEAGILQK